MDSYDLLALWMKDAHIDFANISKELLKIDELHHKYYTHLVIERSDLIDLIEQFKSLKLLKREFYLDGPDEVSKQYGWELPPRGSVLKPDLPFYLDADKDISELHVKIEKQNEKIDFLKSVIQHISNRRYILGRVIDNEKFKHGCN